MIIRLSISNLLSFDKEQTLNLIPAQSSVHQDHVVRSKKRDDIPTLKTSVLYGANASGKSNLIKVLSFLKKAATRNLKEGSSLPIEKFKLGDSKKNKKSRIELEFKFKKDCFAYGLEFSKDAILEEWLYKINKRSEQKIFERKTKVSSKKHKTEVTFGKVGFANSDDEQFAVFTGRGTPINRTFLRECKERNLDVIKEVNDAFQWFDDKLKILFPRTKTKGIEFELDDTNFSKTMGELLNHFGTGISELVTTEVDIEKDVPPYLTDVIDSFIEDLEPGKKGILSSSDGIQNFALEKSTKNHLKIYKLATKHSCKDGRQETFEMNEESDGTRRIIDFLIPLLDMKENDSVYVIDEIDRSLHPILSRGLLEYYYSSAKKSKSQLILTTHESNLLDLDLFRADEIWFVEKDKFHSSNLYSLVEFKPRKSKNIKKGYLNGRYGAIPFLSNPNDLRWEESENPLIDQKVS